MRQLIKAEKVKIEKESFSNTYGKFVVEPLERGHGVTLGNSLRRILLSSIIGAAVISVKIDGVMHEFATLPGVKEDILQLIQNLKKLRIKLYVDEEKQVVLDAKGPLEVRAAHIPVDSELEIVNPDLYIATLNDDKSRLFMQINIAPGHGYVQASENQKEHQPMGTIPIDSIFTPVQKVKYEVVPARVGRKATYDCLIMEIFTDGTIAPDEALFQAARLLQEHAKLFILEDIEEKKREEFKEKFLQMRVDELNIPTVALNALKEVGVEIVKDLVAKEPKELLKIHNFGEKSLEKIEKKLAEYNLSLKGKEQ